MSFSDLVRLKLRELEEPRFDATLSGARILQAELVCPGYNLSDGVLTDLEGKVVKCWKSRYLSLLLPDGRYVAQESYESLRWGLCTWDDHVIWEKDLPIHHDIVLTPQNTLLTFTKEMKLYKGRKVDFCILVEFDLEGKELLRWSTWDHFAELKKFHKPLELDRPKLFFLPEPARRKSATPWGGNYDYYRMNSVQVLPENPLGAKDKRFQRGNLMVSFRHGSMIFILDPKTGAIVWKCISGDVKNNLEGQHAAQMLDNGNILIFDNGRYRGWSRVIEIDPLTYKIIWDYRAENLFTLSQGYAQRLSNGNTLITESERGRAFEVTQNGEVVWEFYHPDIQNSSNSLHPESFGRRQWIYRMTRYSKNFVDKIFARHKLPDTHDN